MNMVKDFVVYCHFIIINFMMIDVFEVQNTGFPEIPLKQFFSEKLISEVTFREKFIAEHIKRSSNNQSGIVSALNSCYKNN
jgi:hypothetical protein